MFRKKSASALLVAGLVFSVNLWAQVVVEDRQIPSPSASETSEPTPLPVLSAQMHQQWQMLQQEVLALRGLVEQQAHELKKLKQQRLDDYLDLDRRLSQMAQRPAAAQFNPETEATTASSPATERISSEAELASYKAGIHLVLREKKYDEAITALTQHVQTFPRGRYSANAQYWLGEIFLLQESLEVSRQWFSRLLKEFPQHTKVPDAQFKLGKVYHQLGDAAQAKSWLAQASQSEGNAARLARDYLEQHFSSDEP